MNPEGALDIIFFVIGGLGLFLFGMRVMSDGLRRVAGEGLRRILRMVTRNVYVAVLSGAAVTCLIQSSSATTVMVVGFVNAGLMQLSQAIGVIMGANIGTTFTAWMVGILGLFKITNYALPAIGIGLLMNMVGKRRWKHWGSVVLGFGLLFFGLSLMKDAFGTLEHSEQVRRLVARFCNHPLSGVLIGTVMTMLVQSSSASIAIAQTLALSGVLTFPQALPFVLGDNIGTTITAQIASVGTNVNARRAARAHMLFNLFGVAIVLPFVWSGHYQRLVDFLVPGDASAPTYVMVHIAFSHSLFNIVNTLIFMPLAGVLAGAVKRIVPGEAGVVQVEPQYLEEHLLETPAIALEQARREVVRMIELAGSAQKDASDAFFSGDKEKIDRVSRKEEAIDNLQNKITQYLIQISQRDLEPEESNELPVLLHSVNDIERLGDHAVNLAEAAGRKIEQELPFSDAAMEEISLMRDEVANMFSIVTHALRENDREAAGNALENEERLNGMERQFRESHLRRLAEGTCNFYSGLTFVDCIYNYEKIGDHLLNAAQAVLGDFQWGEKVRGVESGPAGNPPLPPEQFEPDAPT